jgi:restriction system protein
MKMNENSLFAILLRSPWWISIGVAAATAVASRFMLVKFEMPELYAIFVALPFLVIGSVAGWKQLRAPSAERVAGRLDALRALSWDDFLAAIETAFRRDGYAVNRFKGAGADLELTRAGRVSLVACKRWKATRTGVEPLKELDAAKRASEAGGSIYVAAGDITDNARAFATQANIRLLHDAELAALLPVLPGGKTK